jgi:hypothetical protein
MIVTKEVLLPIEKEDERSIGGAGGDGAQNLLPTNKMAS